MSCGRLADSANIGGLLPGCAGLQETSTVGGQEDYGIDNQQ